MKDIFRSYYRFRGNWFSVYEVLIEFVRSRKNLRFSIWQSRMDRNVHVLVVYGTLLPARMRIECAFIELDHEDIAEFVNHPELFGICGYNDFRNQGSDINTCCFFVPRSND